MPARLFQSSGHLMADRRYEFARDLQLRGDLAAAADLLEQAVELAPEFASAWFTLGEIRRQLGEREAATAAFHEARAADPDDHHGATLYLMQLGAEEVSAMASAYVQTLFDQYAPRFESALVGDLGYRGPALLFKAVLSVRGAAKKPAYFRRAIDLGCGTGLAAAAFASNVDRFVGIDLSPRMIEKSRATSLYAELEVADMLQGLRGKPETSADLILAADAMVYVAELGPCWWRHSACSPPAACSPSPPRPMMATASSSARAGATPTAQPMCAPALQAPGSNWLTLRICPHATRKTSPCPASSWSRPRREVSCPLPQAESG